MQTTTATVKIANGKMFSKGIQNAKRHDGRYNPAAKTWTIKLGPSDAGKLNAPASYGWVIVSHDDAPVAQTTSGRCPHYTVENGCPLHGEFCRG